MIPDVLRIYKSTLRDICCFTHLGWTAKQLTNHLSAWTRPSAIFGVHRTTLISLDSPLPSKPLMQIIFDITVIHNDEGYPMQGHIYSHQIYGWKTWVVGR